jgi:hypothetical protein
MFHVKLPHDDGSDATGGLATGREPPIVSRETLDPLRFWVRPLQGATRRGRLLAAGGAGIENVSIFHVKHAARRHVG